MTPRKASQHSLLRQDVRFLIKTQATRITPNGEISAEAFADDYSKEGDHDCAAQLTNKSRAMNYKLLCQPGVQRRPAKDRFDLLNDIQALVKKAKQPTPSQPSSSHGCQTIRRKDPESCRGRGGMTGNDHLDAGSAAASETYSVSKNRRQDRK